MKSVLIHLRPFDKAANVRRDVYVGDGPSGETYGAGGFIWEPALVARPQMSIELFNLEMDGSVQTGRAQFVIAIDAITAIANPRDLYWKGALVTIHFDASVEGNGNEADFAGYATQASLDVDSGRLTVSAEVSSVLLERPVLTRTFTGGGGIGGDAGKRGELLPAGFGAVKNIEPVWFDLTRNIGMIDGYDNTISIDWLGEGLNSFGARVADYASYDALAAAIDARAIAPGQWGTCVVKGLVGLGAPPVSPITVHATFGCNRPGTLIRRLAIFHAGVADALVDAVACAQLDADVNRPVHYWTKDQRQVKDLIEAIARACNASPLISFQGRLTVTRAVTSNPVATIDLRGGSEPRVIRWRQGQAEPPFFQIRARAARPARVLTTDEVNYVDTLVDRGLYAGGESYRAGNIVWLADGSQWLYINAAPTTGNYPAAGAYWQQMQPPKTASDFRYSTGETINSLRPQEAGANKTETRSAASIAGQGALATQSSATWQSQVTGAGKPTDNADVTLVNTAAAIVGQGALATQSSVSLGTSVRDSTGAVLSDADVRNFFSQGGIGIVDNPQGGSLATNVILAGAIKIVLPFAPADGRNAMLRFNVDIYDYNQRATGTFQIAGYNYSPAPAGWYNCTATRIGASGFARTVRFGRDGATGRWAVWIGEPDTLWYYPQVSVKSLQIGYADSDSVGWSRGWSVSLDQAAATNVDFTVTNPSASDAVFGENTLESPGGVVATVSGYKTAQGTAAAISGQGALATQSSLAYGSAYLSGFNTLATLDRIKLGLSGGLVNEANSAWITDDLAITSLGTAAGIYGQGALATRSSVAYGSAYVSGFGGLAAQTGVRMGGPSGGYAGILNEPGAFWITDAGYHTAQGTAAAILGQSSWATYGGLTPGTVAGQVSQLNAIGQLPAESVYLSGVDYLSNRWPQEANANRTEIRTAAAIAGQGALATQSSLAYGSGYLTGFGGLAAQTGVRMGGPSGSYAGIANEPGSFWITDAGYQTVQGTAAAITGQGALATQSDVNYDTQIGYLPAALLRSSLYGGNYVSADYSYYSGGVVMSALRPQESGANKTETRTAAAISGQGALATKSRADWYLDVAERPDWAIGTTDIGGVEVLQAGYVYRGGGDLRNMYDYFPATTLSDRTGAASAASIAGQGALATQSSLNLDSQAYGQIPDGRNLNASNNFGLRALSSPPVLSDTVIDGQLYLSIGGSTFYGDWGGAVSYPSAVIGPGPFGLTYYIWRNVTGPSDPGSSYDASPELAQALGADKVYIGYVTARGSAGAGPGTGGGSGNPPPGGGGGGGVNLV